MIHLLILTFLMAVAVTAFFSLVRPYGPLIGWAEKVASPRCPCGGSILLPGKGPWWMHRRTVWFFNTAQCAKCRRYVNARTGHPILALYFVIGALHLIGVLLIVILGCVGQSLGGSLELWGGIPFLVLFGLSSAFLYWSETHL